MSSSMSPETRDVRPLRYVCRIEQKQTWFVNFSGTVTRTFSDKAHGGTEAAKAKAIAFRDLAEPHYHEAAQLVARGVLTKAEARVKILATIEPTAAPAAPQPAAAAATVAPTGDTSADAFALAPHAPTTAGNVGQIRWSDDEWQVVGEEAARITIERVCDIVTAVDHAQHRKLPQNRRRKIVAADTLRDTFWLHFNTTRKELVARLHAPAPAPAAPVELPPPAPEKTLADFDDSAVIAEAAARFRNVTARLDQFTAEAVKTRADLDALTSLVQEMGSRPAVAPTKPVVPAVQPIAPKAALALLGFTGMLRPDFEYAQAHLPEHLRHNVILIDGDRRHPYIPTTLKVVIAARCITLTTWDELRKAVGKDNAYLIQSGRDSIIKRAVELLTKLVPAAA